MKLRTPRAAVNARAHLQRIQTPTRGDLTEALAAFVQAWDQAADPVDLMKRMTPHIKRARAMVDHADEARLDGGLL